MGISRTCYYRVLWRDNPLIPIRAASMGISTPGTPSPAFLSPAGGQPPGKCWHGSLALAVPLGLPRLPQPGQEQAPAWHAAGTNFGPKGFPPASMGLKTILAGVFLPRLPATRSRAGVFVLCVHVCVCISKPQQTFHIRFLSFPHFFSFPFPSEPLAVVFK